MPVRAFPDRPTRAAACAKCKREIVVLERPPACLHLPPCSVSICAPCQLVRWKGPCATEAMGMNPPQAYLTIERSDDAASG